MKLAINHATLKKTPMESFLKAISFAGFEGVELRRDETFEYLEDNSVKDLKNLLELFGLECITFNAIELFSLCPEIEFHRILKYTERLMFVGNQIGCDKIIAVPSFSLGKPLTEEVINYQTVKRLKIIAELAEKYKFKIGFEPLGFPYCSVRKIDHALKIIENEELPEMGLVIDTFHYFLAEHTPDDIKNVDANKIWLVHINDSTEKPLDQLQDSDRVFPDEGFFNLNDFIQNLKEIGYDGWISLELFNERIWDEGPSSVAEKAMESMKKFI